MGTIIETDIEVPDAGEIITPVADALGWYEFGVTEARSLRNLANPANPLTIATGTLPVEDGYVTIGEESGDARLDTQIPEADQMTFFFVSRATSSGTDIRILTNYVTSTNKGLGVRYVSGGIRVGRANGTNFISSAVLELADRTQWTLFACTFGATSRIYDLTHNKNTAIAVTNFEKNAANNITFGPPTKNNAGRYDIALAAIYPGAMTTSQLNEVAAFIRSELEYILPGVVV